MKIKNFKFKRDYYNGFRCLKILNNLIKSIPNNIEIITNEYRVQNVFMCKNDEYKDYL